MTPKEALEALPVLREELDFVCTQVDRNLWMNENYGCHNEPHLRLLEDMANNLWEALRRATKIASRMHY
jgi:hypothetical protein